MRSSLIFVLGTTLVFSCLCVSWGFAQENDAFQPSETTPKEPETMVSDQTVADSSASPDQAVKSNSASGTGSENSPPKVDLEALKRSNPDKYLEMVEEQLRFYRLKNEQLEKEQREKEQKAKISREEALKRPPQYNPNSDSFYDEYGRFAGVPPHLRDTEDEFKDGRRSFRRNLPPGVDRIFNREERRRNLQRRSRRGPGGDPHSFRPREDLDQEVVNPYEDPIRSMDPGFDGASEPPPVDDNGHFDVEEFRRRMDKMREDMDRRREEIMKEVEQRRQEAMREVERLRREHPLPGESGTKGSDDSFSYSGDGKDLNNRDIFMNRHGKDEL